MRTFTNSFKRTLWEEKIYDGFTNQFLGVKIVSQRKYRKVWKHIKFRKLNWKASRPLITQGYKSRKRRWQREVLLHLFQIFSAAPFLGHNFLLLIRVSFPPPLLNPEILGRVPIVQLNLESLWLLPSKSSLSGINKGNFDALGMLSSFAWYFNFCVDIWKV